MSYGAIDVVKCEADPLLATSKRDEKHFKLETTPLNPFSALTFNWIVPLLKKGNAQEQLNPKDLAAIPLPASCETKNVTRTFEYYWNADLQRAAASAAVADAKGEHGTKNKKGKNYEPSLVWCLVRSFHKDYILAGCLKIVHDGCVFVGPIVLHGLIQFLRSSDSTVREGLVLTASVTLSQILMSFCLRHYFFKCYLTGLRMRSVIVMAVYKKALRLSSAERQRRTVGEILNLMTVDAQRIQDLTTYGHAVWYSLLQIALAIYFLWQQLGPSCLGGVAVILIMVPVNKIIAGWMGNLQKKLMKARDGRVDVNNEVLGSMKVIKLQAWEDSFKKRIQDLRDIELKQVLSNLLLNGSGC